MCKLPTCYVQEKTALTPVANDYSEGEWSKPVLSHADLPILLIFSARSTKRIRRK